MLLSDSSKGMNGSAKARINAPMAINLLTGSSSFESLVWWASLFSGKLTLENFTLYTSLVVKDGLRIINAVKASISGFPHSISVAKLILDLYSMNISKLSKTELQEFLRKRFCNLKHLISSLLIPSLLHMFTDKRDVEMAVFLAATIAWGRDR